MTRVINVIDLNDITIEEKKEDLLLAYKNYIKMSKKKLDKLEEAKLKNRIDTLAKSLQTSSSNKVKQIQPIPGFFYY